MPAPLRSPSPGSGEHSSSRARKGRGRPWLIRLAEPVLISAGFVASRVAYHLLIPENYARLTTGELAGGFLVSVVTFWAALRLLERAGQRESWTILLQQFCVGTGLSLVVHAVFNYFQLLTRSFFLIVVGGLFAALFLGIFRLWIYRRVYRETEISPEGVLIVGSDPIANELARSLGQPILGAIGPPSSGSVADIAPDAVAGAAIPVLGEIRQFEKIVSERRPTHILMALQDWASSISPSALWKLRLSGVTISDIPGLYEKLFQRVYCRECR